MLPGDTGLYCIFCHMTQQETLKLLWEKYVNDQKLNAREIAHLRVLIQDVSNRDLVMELLDSVYEQNSEVAPAEYSSHDAFQEVWEKLQLEGSAKPAPAILISSRRNWWKYAAAAVLILAVGVSLNYFTKRNTPELLADQQPVATPEVQIQPGGNKAMLTLADGSIVSLGEQENGVVAKQGGTNVVKLTNGELAYEPVKGQPASVGYNTIVTPRGGKYRLTLPDGSKVWMNAESSLRYPTSFSGNTREVQLTGEAYFEIARNPSRPFQVQVKELKVEVLGTHFNIMAYANEPAIATTLVEGSVRVSSPSQLLQLKPGQQALQENNGSMKLLETVDLQQVLAWKNDYFQFNGDGLDRLMRQVERWYDVSVMYEGPVPARKFGGKISRSSSLTDVLKVLELSDVKFRVAGKTITVTNN